MNIIERWDKNEIGEYFLPIYIKSFKETTMEQPGCNKIFSSDWINDSEVVFGSKCGKLYVYNFYKNRLTLLREHERTTSGIRNIKRMDFDNYFCYSIDGKLVFNKYIEVIRKVKIHDDWVTNFEMIDNNYVTTSKNGEIKIYDMIINECKLVKKYKYDYVRDFIYRNKKIDMILKNDEECRIVNYDLVKNKETKIIDIKDKDCVIIEKFNNMNTVGSNKYITLYDERGKKSKIKYKIGINSRVRSLDFLNNNVISAGIGDNRLVYIDIRLNKSYHTRKINSEWIKEDHIYDIMPVDYSSSTVFTHKMNGLKTFVGGGPTLYGLTGSYINILV